MTVFQLINVEIMTELENLTVKTVSGKSQKMLKFVAKSMTLNKIFMWSPSISL